MPVINFKLSPEFQSLRETRKLINDTSKFGACLAEAVAAVASKHSKQRLSAPSASADADNATAARELIGLAARPESVDFMVSATRLEIPKNIYCLHSVSNFGFLEQIFMAECEFKDLKDYRTGGEIMSEESNVRNSRITRRKAEEVLRNGQVEDALKFFRQAEEKNPRDFTIHYQVGLVEFFDRGDFDGAMASFSKAAKESQGKSSMTFMHSMCMIGLVSRLAGEITGDLKFFDEAYNASVQAYNFDPKYLFCAYSVAQCLFAISYKGSNYASDARNMARDIIRKERMYVLQMAADIAFAKFAAELRDVYNQVIKDISNETNDILKECGEAITRLQNQSKYLSVPSKAAGFREEQTKLSGAVLYKNVFDLARSKDEARGLIERVQELFQEVSKNKVYFELREMLGAKMAEYDAELRDMLQPFNALVGEYGEAKKQLDEINKHYPPGKDSEDAQNDDPRNSGGWYGGTFYIAVKMFTGCSLSTVTIAALFGFYVALGIEISWITFVFAGMMILMTPVYGTIAAEAYYIMIENKRKNLQFAVKKLEKTIEVRKPAIEEIQKKARQKYINEISEKMKVARQVAEQMFDAFLAGEPERIKKLVNLS